MIENIKARFRAEKYNIWTEQLDHNCKDKNWYANGKLWYGHPLFVFFESAKNNWFIGSQSYIDLTNIKGK